MTCDFMSNCNLLTRIGVRSAPMHSDRTQDYRERTLAAFKDGSLPVLVATDVASRFIYILHFLKFVFTEFSFP